MVDFQSRDTDRGVTDDEDDLDEEAEDVDAEAEGVDAEAEVDERADETVAESAPDDAEVGSDSGSHGTEEPAESPGTEHRETGLDERDGTDPLAPDASGLTDGTDLDSSVEETGVDGGSTERPAEGDRVESSDDQSHDHGDTDDPGRGHRDIDDQTRDHGHDQSHGHGHDDGHEHSHAHGHEDVGQLGVAVVTVSSTRTRETDPSGDAIVSSVESADHEVVTRDLVGDDLDGIQRAVLALTARDDVDVVVTTGGTGVTPDDVTVEALSPLFDKTLPGFGELFRILSYEEVGTRALGSRATAGISEGVPVFCLPGSEDAVRLGMAELVTEEVEHLVGLATRES